MVGSVLRTYASPLLLLAVIAAFATGCGERPGGTTASGSGDRTAASRSRAVKPSKPESLSLEPPAYAGYEPLPILTYHNVDPSMKNEYAISPQEFERQLVHLRDNGYTSVTARELYEHQTTGTPLPAKPVMITFDDGWKSQYTNAAPLLAKHGFKATFFINPRMIGRGSGYMTREMLAELTSAGSDIESHTWGHVSVVRPAGSDPAGFAQMIGEQLTKAADRIEQDTGKAPVAFSYPYGNWDLEAADRIDKAGYRLAFTTDEGIADARPWDRLALKRMTIARGETMANFARRLESLPLPARDIAPPPGSHVASTTTVLVADITAVPESVKDLKFSAGSAVGETTLVTRDGRRYATAPLTGAKVGSRGVILSGRDAGGRRHIASWILQIGF
jgi:peptidoglycan/xylan/chitin deacetylase (PgdA/CDA1 family)